MVETTNVTETVAVKTGKWTEEDVKVLMSIYDPEDSDNTVLAAMKELNRSKRSITGKLVSEKAYVAPEKPVRQKKDEGPTKGEILTSLAKLGYDPEGLDAATKPALKTLEAFVASKAVS